MKPRIPDGSRVVFWGAQNQLYAMAVDAADGPALVGRTPRGPAPTAWMSDGTILVSSGSLDVYRLDEGGGPATAVLEAGWREFGARPSPDGSLIAYISDESGSLQAYVRRWPELDGQTRVSEAAVPDGQNLLWGPDGRTLYIKEEASLTEVTLTLTGESIRVQGRRVMGPTPGWLRGLMSDEPRFLVAGRRDEFLEPEGDPPRLMAVTHWLSSVLARHGASAAR